MSDVNKVRSSGTFYGFEDTVARERISDNTIEIGILNDRINALNPDLDISDLVVTAGASSRSGYSTLRLSDGTHTKTVDIPVSSLDPADKTTLENLVKQYIGDISGNYEVSDETLIIKSVTIDDGFEFEDMEPAPSGEVGDPQEDPSVSGGN